MAFDPSSSRMMRGAAALALAATCTLAQAQLKADEWRFAAAVYGYFPSLKSDTQFPSGRGGPTIDVSGDTLVSNLKMAFMGSFAAQKGVWGVWTDVFYSDVGGDKTGLTDFRIGGQPTAVPASLSLDAKTTIWTLAGTYTFADAPSYTANVLVGTRMLSVDQTLDWQFLAPSPNGLIAPAGRSEVSKTNWDAIVGVNGRYRMGDALQWVVPYYVDIGAGNSKFTWQAMLGLGYDFKWGEVGVAWRYIDYDFKSGNAIQTMSFNGPMLGARFTW
ncbi:MAG TPA: hypothetical protein PLN55_03625 [Burkholderiaceae bacterium]|nr:hypothetical protein [Burkholderiaceae bacterium]HPE01036.1 hypothetical protein [Burkholderiaceae bacterium]